MNLPKHIRRIIYASVICIATILGTMFFGVNPMLDAANNANLGTDQNDALLNVEISRVRHLQLLTRNKLIVDAQSAELGDAMPEEPRISTMVDALNNFANTNGLVVTSLTVGDPEKFVIPGKVHAQAEFQAAILKAGASVKSIPVNLTVDGPFNSLLQFMDDVENSPRVMLIKQFQFQSGVGPGNFTLQVQASVFMVTHK